ncbi:MAG: RIP metalloprotease RseP [Sneathiellaceae bacterium]
MPILNTLIDFVLPFLVVLSVIIFVHEMGHYWVARACGVRIDTFSIGFGRELLGWTNRHGTRWRVAAIPLGGYVKFFGDAGAASTPGGELDGLRPEERAVCFHYKPLWQRAAIVAAGPGINFVFAILVYALLFSTVGQPKTEPVVTRVMADMPAAAAGIQIGDRIVAADGVTIDRFQELRNHVALRAETPINLVVERDGQMVDLVVTPRRTTVDTGAGGEAEMGVIGIQAEGIELVRHDPVTSLWLGTQETWHVAENSLTYVWRIIAGRESGDQLSGPIGIAKISGDVAQIGFLAVVSLMATLSVAIGLINLFPVPMLDGGHLLFYAVEAVRGRPLGERAQEYGFRVGLALILSLFVFATWNDLNRLEVFSFFGKLFS